MFADRVARIPVRETGEYRNARADRPRPERAAGPGAIMWCLDTRPGRARSCTNWRTSSSSALRSADQPLRASRPAPSSIKRYVEHYVENKVRDQKIFGGVPAARPHDKTLAQKAEAAVTPPLRPNAQGGIDLSPPSNVTSREDYDRVLVPHAPAKGQSVTIPQIPLDLTPAAPPVSSYKYNGGPHESYEAGAAIDFTITPRRTLVQSVWSSSQKPIGRLWNRWPQRASNRLPRRLSTGQRPANPGSTSSVSIQETGPLTPAASG